MEKQVVYFPDEIVQAMKARVISSLADDQHDPSGQKDSLRYVSSSDVVDVFISNPTVQQLPASSTGSAIILNPVIIRGRMPFVFLSANDINVTNAQLLIPTIMPLKS
ncbi:hypothetical protein QQS21_004851 [Conoideocrella luteorostrata]|uniref:Uncharacterized protein n=1 Tax=Conoideocrella luteorostrata TaxID=1105319 RepID=A0AAJ0CQR3_9HYPO|nr:hypothetical protein QQS21_004851 [Conoideocrella luteorostrata]